MPELPEVEVTRRSFAARIEGARVLGVRLGKPLRWPLGVGTDRLVGRTVGAVSRRGKYLWMPLLDAGPVLRPEVPSQAWARAEFLAPDATGGAALAGGGTSRDATAAAGGGLLMHLGMSGSLSFLPGHAGAPLAGSHDHFDLETSAGLLRLTDPRRFGAVVWSPGLDQLPASRLLAGLGLEPFDVRFDGLHLHAAFQRRRVAVKTALLAGDIVVGAGNIYASEALFAAGIDPRLRCDRLSRPRCARLASAIRDTLMRALALGGSTLRDFRDAHGMAGAFQAEAQVYGREGLPCRSCSTAVRRIVQGQRSTYFCPRCQRR